MAKRRCERSAAAMRGFTLVELLLAVALTVVIAALAYAGIETARAPRSRCSRKSRSSPTFSAPSQ